MNEYALTKRERQVLDALSFDWQRRDEILANIHGKQMYPRWLYTQLHNLMKKGFVEKEFDTLVVGKQRYRLKKRGIKLY